MKTFHGFSLAICFCLNLTNSIAQIDPADDFVGYYAAHDTVTIADMTDSIVSVTIRDYIFNITKVDSNHISFQNFDANNDTVVFPIISYGFEAIQIQGAINEYCDVSGNKSANILHFVSIRCLGAPITIKTSGIGIQSFSQPQSIENAHYQAIRCYPTFTTGEIHFDFPPEIVGNIEIELYDMQGKKVFQQAKQSPEGDTHLSTDISPLQTGIYFWKITTQTRIYTGKIAKTN